jgi:hypothetical protein
MHRWLFFTFFSWIQSRYPCQALRPWFHYPILGVNFDRYARTAPILELSFEWFSHVSIGPFYSIPKASVWIWDGPSVSFTLWTSLNQSIFKLLSFPLVDHRRSSSLASKHQDAHKKTLGFHPRPAKIITISPSLILNLILLRFSSFCSGFLHLLAWCRQLYSFGKEEAIT